MSPLQRRVAALPICGLAVLAAAPGAAVRPAPIARAVKAPPAPPNGTYVYALARDGSDVGTATVTITRRDELATIETNEVVAIGAFRAHVLASYRYADFGIASYVATYQAPFPRAMPLGRIGPARPRADFYGQSTVRYRVDGRDASATIDGVRGTDRMPDVRARVGHLWIVDGPVMTGVLLLPAFRRRSHDAELAVASEAFPSSDVDAPQTLVRATPKYPKTPATDLVVDVPGLARVWYAPGNDIVDEARDVPLNVDARLVAYARIGATAPFVAADVPASPTPVPTATISLSNAEGAALSGVLARPVAAKRTPLVVLVAPGASGGIDYGGDGPEPMFEDLARAFVGRGYAVLRYASKSVPGGAPSKPTWDASLADVRAALAAARDTDGIDPARTYLVGYGTGADLALVAASGASAPVAGVVALGPTTTAGYRACSSALASEPPSWRASALGHDPAALAARVRVPVIAFHPGVPMCGESPDVVRAYDAALRANDPRASAVAASDLSQRFGGRFDADAPAADSEALFPYRFDASTASAIADWMDGPKTAAPAPLAVPSPGSIAKPPPPPPDVDRSGASLPTPHASQPAARASDEPAPGVVLPSGETPPPAQVAPPTPSPSPDPNATQAPATAPTPVAT